MIKQHHEDRLENARFPLARPPVRWGRFERVARAPIVRLVVYYALVMVAATALVRFVPAAREALLQPSVPALREGAEILTGRGGPGADATSAPDGASGPRVVDVDTSLHHRALVTLIVIIGAIVLALPVAWVYMWTKRLRFDPGLVRSIIILPIAVAGILLVVKNSLATAFSLAGIVAAVRFRNTLKDPQDAVYVFLTIAIGISAGVQALDVTLIVSLVFNVMVVAMWKLRLGSLTGESYGQAGTLAIGDVSLHVARTPASCRRVRRGALDHVAAAGIDAPSADGVLLIHDTSFEHARDAVQDTLNEATVDWRLIDIHKRGGEIETAEYLVALAHGVTPLDLMGELDEWSSYFEAAEYVPFRHLRHPGDRNPTPGPGPGTGSGTDPGGSPGSGGSRPR